MTNENAPGLDNATQRAIGERLECQYHTCVSIHDMASQLIANGRSEDSALLWAIQELARGQARELEAMAGQLQDQDIGFYAEHFKGTSLV